MNTELLLLRERTGLLDELGLVPDHADLEELIRRALDQNRLSIMDLQTIRDLLELCGLDGGGTDIPVFLLAGLLIARNGGSVCLRYDRGADPASMWREWLHPSAEAVNWAASAWDRIRSSFAGDASLSGMIQTVRAGEAVARPVIAVERDGGSFLYFQRYYRHEQGLRERLRELAAREAGDTPPADLPARIHAVASYEGFQLSPEQRMAVYMALRRPFTLVTGGPGTGKTTVICSLLRAMLAGGVAPERIALAAPTGRAGQRMGDSIRHTLRLTVNETGAVRDAMLQMQGRTIHRLLKYNPAKGGFMHDREHPLPLDVLIVDEVSMVDLVLMHRLLEALPGSCRVILLGDKDQLPSVDAGTVLGDLVPRDHRPAYSAATMAELRTIAPEAAIEETSSPSLLTDRIVMLATSHRNRGDLAAVARHINQGDADTAMKGMAEMEFTAGGADWNGPDTSCVRIRVADPSDPELVRRLVLSWTTCFLARGGGACCPLPELASRPFPVSALADEAGSAAEQREARETADRMFMLLDAARILAVLRNGPFGVQTINRHAAGHWRALMDPLAPASREYFAGAPVMITRNAPDRELFNGDTGVVVRDREQRYYGLFPRGDRYILCPVERLPEYELAFAVTVHKSQGSQYGRVLLVLPPDPDLPLLTREIIYTGITRAVDSAFVCGTDDVIRGAIRRRLQRQSGLDLWRMDDEAGRVRVSG